MLAIHMVYLSWVCENSLISFTILPIIHLFCFHSPGTLITEWDLGTSICQKIFSSKLAVEKLVTKMVDITRFYNFDGWLINIENTIEKEWIENIEFFLSDLKKQMQMIGKHHQLIWYDSVTIEGKLDWQNELNDKNRYILTSFMRNVIGSNDPS